MADKNFIVKNGLEVGGQEVVSSSGVVTSAALGGQTLASTDSPTFNNLTLTNDIAVGGDLNLTGDLNITGDVNSLSVTDLDVTDQTITLGAGQVESASGGSGIVVDGSNASILWDETNTEWDFNKGVNVTGTVTADGLTVDGTGAQVVSLNSTANGSQIAFDSATTSSDWLVGISNDTTDDFLIYQAGAGTGDIRLYTDGTERLTVLHGGNVGIGYTAPNGKLNVSGRASINCNWAYNDAFIIQSTQANSTTLGAYRTDGTTPILIAREDGNVGIGTNSPDAPLSFGANIPSDGQTIHTYQSGNTRSGLGIVSSVHRMFTDTTSSLSFGQVSTTDGSTYTERMRITSSGNVGIGTDSPNAKLEIKGASSTNYLQFNNSSDSELFRIDSNFNWAWGTTTPTQAFDMRDNSGNALFSVDRANGKVGIGTNTPDSNLHVLGTNPVIRVSDDGTTGYSTLELRQQNTATEGTELIYDSTTGHTHLNTVFGADLKIATNTGSFGTTNTNTRLTVKSDGEIHVGKSGVSTDRIEFVGNTNISAPSTSNHDLGTRLSLYDGNTTSWYAIGIESNHMWFNADGGIFKFYQQAVQKIHFDGTNPMPVVRVGPSATNAMTLGSVTSVFPYSGLNMIVATPGAALTVHSGTNSAGTWVNLHSSLSDYLRGTATFSTINTSQQANIIVYLNVATKVYLARQTNWNSVSTTGWTQISNDSTVISDNESHNVYVRYLPAGTHSLDNDSALYFFEAPIGP